MRTPVSKLVSLSVFGLCLMLMPADSSAQYGYGGYGYGGYGGYGAVVRPAGVPGAAFIRTMPTTRYGYGGYGGYGYGSAAFIYRSPSSFDRRDDPYMPEQQVSTLERSMQRFRDLRERSRSEDTHYSNEVYKRNYPFDQLYYERMMTP